VKRILFVLTGILIYSVMNAQVLTSPPPEDDGFRTIFEDQELKFTAFGGPMMSFTMVNGEFSHMMGGGGGLMINGFYFGGYGQGMTNKVGINTNQHIDFGHGGFMTGVVIGGKRAIHPTFNTLIGWGNVSIENDDWRNNTDEEESSCFVFEPSLQIEMNFTRFFRLAVGGGYRLVSGMNGISDLGNGDFSEPSVSLAFKFGWF